MVAKISTTQRYFDDPLCFEFTAEVTEIIALPDGRSGAILASTYFYPTSGGQEHDMGKIGEALVKDVYAREDGRIIHVLDCTLDPGEYPAQIDRERRLRAMQHHTAQHILSGAFETILELGTVSANINGYSPSTIDLAAGDVSQSALQRVEAFANGVIFENRAVKSYFVTDDEIGKVPFRRPPKVSGTIRVIEVDGFDYSACGGTHCPQTGMVGLVKILRTERVNQKLRIHFVAGRQALETFQGYQAAVQAAAVRLDVRPEQVGEAVHEQLERMRQLQLEADALRQAQLGMMAERLAEKAEPVAGVLLVMALFRDFTPSELRTLGSKLVEAPNHVALLAAFDGQKLSMVAACSKGTNFDARNLLKQHLAPINGRGGGDVSLAQGGGACDEAFLERLFANTSTYLGNHES
jgi:alanyl-tRNA synthetase